MVIGSGSIAGTAIIKLPSANTSCCRVASDLNMDYCGEVTLPYIPNLPRGAPIDWLMNTLMVVVVLLEMVVGMMVGILNINKIYFNLFRSLSIILTNLIT